MEATLCIQLIKRHLQQSSRCTRALYVAQAVTFSLMLQGVHDRRWVNEAASYAAVGCWVAVAALVQCGSRRGHREERYSRTSNNRWLWNCLALLWWPYVMYGLIEHDRRYNPNCPWDDAFLVTPETQLRQRGCDSDLLYSSPNGVCHKTLG